MVDNVICKKLVDAQSGRSGSAEVEALSSATTKALKQINTTSKSDSSLRDDDDDDDDNDDDDDDAFICRKISELLRSLLRRGTAMLSS